MGRTWNRAKGIGGLVKIERMGVAMNGGSNIARRKPQEKKFPTRRGERLLASPKLRDSSCHGQPRQSSARRIKKAKFRDHVRGKTPVEMANEVLCKSVCHNICCLIREAHELGIRLEFRPLLRLMQSVSVAMTDRGAGTLEAWRDRLPNISAARTFSGQDAASSRCGGQGTRFYHDRGKWIICTLGGQPSGRS